MDVFATLSKAPQSIFVDVLWKVCFWSTQASQKKGDCAAPAHTTSRQSTTREPSSPQGPEQGLALLKHSTCARRSQVLTWLLLPFVQVYADAGDFTAGARCMTSLKV
jgi:hypothetical protein